MKTIYKIRWLSRRTSYKSFVQNWSALLGYTYNETKRENKADRIAKMTGYYRKLQSFTRWMLAAIVLDILSCVNHMQINFQADNLDYVDVAKIKTETIDQLTELKDETGKFESEVKSYLFKHSNVTRNVITK